MLRAHMATVVLKPGHVQPVWAGHPWVFAQAIDRVEGGAVRGDEVRVVDPRGALMGRGFYSPGSALAVRILVRDDKTELNGLFFRRRLERAVRLRAELGLPSDETSGYRVVHGEGDGLPGLIVDRFGDALVVQFLTFGMKQREAVLLEALEDVLSPRSIIDRTPANAAKLEQFDAAAGVVRGADVTSLTCSERGLRYTIPLELGQKTGFYFDQRELRARVERLARGKRVLDAYSFVGSFAMAAARGGASHVTAVDESPIALEVAAECARANGLPGIDFMRQDARKALDESHGAFDLVIADPPRLAPTVRARQGALVAYTKLAERACRATKPGGWLVFCSCSAAVDLQALTRALATGAVRCNMQAVVHERHFQGPDHPVPSAFGEGLYLKALLARVDVR